MFRRTPKSTVPEGWQPKRRAHGSFRPVYRSKENNQLTFLGKGDGETVEMVVRKHPLFLVWPGLPALGLLILLLVFGALLIRFPSYAPILALLEVLLSVAFFIALIYFIWRDVSIWWFSCYIITNKRIIVCSGVLTPKREYIGLDKIVQVALAQGSAQSIFLAYGDVYLYLVGSGKHVIKDVPRPRSVRDALDGIYASFKAASKKAAEPLPELHDSEVKAMIEKMGKKEKEPTLQNADAPYEHRRNPARLRGPLRPFGIPFLRFPLEIHYTSDEYTVMYIQRSRWLLRFKMLGPATLLLVAVVMTFILPNFAVITVGIGLVALVLMALVTLNFIDDVFILTNRRVIDVERKYFILVATAEEVEYKNIKETKVHMRTVFHNLFDLGTVTVETPGSQPNIDMTAIDHPFFIADKINEIKGFEKKMNDAKTVNKGREDLVKWFTNVASVLEKKMVSRGVPNLQKMDLWRAAAIAAEMGMKVVPIGEDDSYPHIEAGLIVSQNPLPGTLMSVDGDERPQIQVTLSKSS